MESVTEQRICVKFCFTVRKTAAETHILRKAYGFNALSQTTIYECFRHFKMEELQQMTLSSLADLEFQDLNL
jgi:hypothetical protein